MVHNWSDNVARSGHWKDWVLVLFSVIQIFTNLLLGGGGEAWVTPMLNHYLKDTCLGKSFLLGEVTSLWTVGVKKWSILKILTDTRDRGFSTGEGRIIADDHPGSSLMQRL